MIFRFKTLALFIAGSLPLSAHAQASQTVFDLKTLEALGYTRDVADFFSKEARFLPGENTIRVGINGSRSYTTTARFNSDGALCFDEALLNTLKLSSDKLKGECSDIKTLWPDASVTLIPGQFRAEITVPESAIAASDERYARGGYAVLLNYNAFAQDIRSSASQFRYYQSMMEPGINVSNWVIRNRSNFTSGLDGDTFTYEETSASRAIESMKSILQLGEFGVQGSSWSGLPMTGVQLFSDSDQTLAAQLLIPIQGIAATNATVEVRQRGRIIYRTLVPAGPFTLTHIDGLSSGVPVDVDIIEENGSRQHFTVANVAGLSAVQTASRYQLGIGRYRPYRGDGESLDSPLLATAESYFTVNGDKGVTAAVLASSAYQSASLRSTWTGSDRGWVSGGLNYARNQRGRQGAQADAQGQISLGNNLALSASVLHRSKDYFSADEALGMSQDWDQQSYHPLRTSASASMSWADTRWGAWSYTYSRNEYHRGGRDAVHSLSTGHNVGSATINLSLQSSSSGEKSVYAGLSLQLGGGSLSTRYQRYGGVSTLGTTYRNQPDGNMSYSLGASGTEDSRRLNGSLTMSTPYAQLGAAASRSTTQSQSVSLSASGGVALANGQLATSSQPIGETFAVVKVPDQGHLRVQSAGSGSTLTNAAGTAVIPRIRPYAKSTAQVDTRTLPLNLRLDSTSADFQLARGTVASRNFGVTLVRQLLLTIRDRKGDVVPLGSSVLDNSGKFIASVVGDGNVMLTNEQIGTPLRIKIANASECRVAYPVPERFDPEALYEEADATCH